MSDIAEDIRERAENIAGIIGVTPYSDMRVHVVHAVSLAIRDERERCAGIAERRAQDVRGSYGARYVAGHIASEIRAAQSPTSDSANPRRSQALDELGALDGELL